MTRGGVVRRVRCRTEDLGRGEGEGDGIGVGIVSAGAIFAENAL